MQSIPPEFYDSESGEPIKHCRKCQKELIDSHSEYVIEKVIRKVDDHEQVLFEYALCMNCIQEVQGEISEESAQNIKTYMLSKMEAIRERPFMGTRACLWSGTPREDLKEFQMIAKCVGDKTFSFQPPFLISGSMMEELDALLSSKTRDTLEGFMDDNFGPPPEFRELFRKTDLVIF